MVALKAELGPVIPGVPGISAPSWEVFVAAGSDALPGTGTNLGTFNHNESADPFHKGLNHVVFHHIRDILYRRQKSTPANTTPPAPPAGTILPPGYTEAGGVAPGSMFPIGFHDMTAIKMKRHGAIMLSTAITAPGVSMAPAGTATIVLKYQPGDVAAVNADHDFVSSSVLTATVSAVGVVTGVAPGNAYVRVTNKFNGLVVDVPVTVTGAGIFRTGVEGDDVNGQTKSRDVLRKDDEQLDDRRKVKEQEEKDLKEAKAEAKEKEKEAKAAEAKEEKEEKEREQEENTRKAAAEREAKDTRDAQDKEEKDDKRDKYGRQNSPAKK